MVNKKTYRVYIAGKLNDDAVGYIKNVHRMVEWAETVRRAGFSVYIPAIDVLVGFIKGDLEYDDYFNNSQPFLEVCHAVYVCPGFETSSGTKREIEEATKLGIPIFYDVDDLIYHFYRR